MRVLSFWFSSVSSVKDWIFKHSHHETSFIPLTSWFRGGFTVKGLLFPPFTSVHRPCECFEIQTFKPKITENQTEIRTLWRNERFFWGNKNNINARVKRIAQTDGSLFSMTSPPRCPCRALREVLFTTRWLLRTTRRVGKTTPGLVGTISGLVEKAYHHVFTSETSVIYNLQLCLRPWSQEYCIVLYDGRQT